MSDPSRFHRWLIQSRQLTISDEKTFARMVTPDRERTQQILTPAQQLEMRKRVADAADIDAALAVIDGYIFKDETDGEVDKINIKSGHQITI